MVSLEYATLSQIADELKRRATRYKTKLTDSSTTLLLTVYNPGLPIRLIEIADELREMSV